MLNVLNLDVTTASSDVKDDALLVALRFVVLRLSSGFSCIPQEDFQQPSENESDLISRRSGPLMKQSVEKLTFSVLEFFRRMIFVHKRENGSHKGSLAL